MKIRSMILELFHVYRQTFVADQQLCESEYRRRVRPATHVPSCSSFCLDDDWSLADFLRAELFTVHHDYIYDRVPTNSTSPPISERSSSRMMGLNPLKAEFLLNNM
jgi:hypothetical protein